MTALKVPTLDETGRVRDKHLPSRLSDASLSATYVRFVDENGNPLENRNVVIKVDSTSGEILDIVSEV
jgi:hypothetical protein